MKSSQLRIGNLFTDSLFLCSVSRIEETSIWGKTIDVFNHSVARNEDYYATDNEYHFNIENTNPIPLTEEWLLKFGFERIPHYTITNSIIKKTKRGRCLSIGCVGTPNEMVFLSYQEDESSLKIDDLICLWNYDFDGRLYVHQLQNLYFALTGEELTIK
jgi:hypothetical protein